MEPPEPSRNRTAPSRVKPTPQHQGRDRLLLITKQPFTLPTNGSLQVPNKTLVSGSLNGELQTKSLTVESYGHITGKINCENADIAGHVGDDLTSTEFLILRSSSVISGDIFYKEMQIDKGAKITGKLIML